MSPLSERALSIMVGQLGQKENPIGSNWGRPVQNYLSSVGIFFPASWCMALVYWSFNEAAGQLGLENPLMKTGGVLVQWHNRPKNQIVSLNWDLIEPGDIMIMDHGHGLGHTGMVEKKNIDKTLGTVEGNTNDTGSREGIEVDRKIRHLTAPIIGFLRF